MKALLLFIVFLLIRTCMARVPYVGRLNLGFQASMTNFLDFNGKFLSSNNSVFDFGFETMHDTSQFLLVVVHRSSLTIVWSANRGSPVQYADLLTFDTTGNAYLKRGGHTVWSTDTANKGVAAIELLDSGNLVLVGNDSSIIWQSFSHPVNALLSNQEFAEGMKLVSDPGSNGLHYSLEMVSGDLILSAGYQPPQPYWTIGKDNRIFIDKTGGNAVSASLTANSWKFYDQNKVMLWQFVFSYDSDPNNIWAAFLGDDGFITFTALQTEGSNGTIVPSQKMIPEDQCSRPAACSPVGVCLGNNQCTCPDSLPFCKPANLSYCNGSGSQPGDFSELVDAGEGLSYAALDFVPPSAKTDLKGCRTFCLGNCSCAAMFFQNNSGNCFLFDQIGSLKYSENGSRYATYIKVLNDVSTGRNRGTIKKRLVIALLTVASTVVVFVVGLIYAGYHCCCRMKRKETPESSDEPSKEVKFFEGLPGAPVRFSYNDLKIATNNFKVKLGNGGFGSVYHGILPDGAQLAVKKLEGIGQGKKEFWAEVSTIGSIHHRHLVRLKGFCSEGTHRLLAYEYMANGSLDRWLFRKGKREMVLDWETRYNIALGTAKGLAYLHKECDAKIIHCDIKPENVLLDDNFLAKVSDFGLAKLMNQEQSLAFTTLRGTRGYLAPEWIKNHAISEKIDVYSYGMALLEIIGGRKNFDLSVSSEKSDLPAYTFKMLEEGKLKDIIDPSLEMDEKDDERASEAIKVALWCIQDEKSLRPSMAKAVQMLEGISPVPTPPASSHQSCSLLDPGFFMPTSDGGAGSGMRLSWPR